ncbi:MAG: class I SAM-dependent RNA methyltransferase [Verrucomicrobia bacterium]|nr:class I SAM-dependent RNA methyltransferase [Verrucomicrobiota bacterium]
MKRIQSDIEPRRSITVSIHDVAFGGQGVGRAEGKIVFVPFTIDGEEVEATVMERRKRFDSARLDAVILPAPERVVPRCVYYAHCGGCDYQHIAYHHQLELKQRQVQHLLQRIGGIGNIKVLPVVPSPRPYGFRNRITVHSAEGNIGFFAKNSRSVVDIESCAIALPEVNSELRKIRAAGLAAGRHKTLRAPGVPHTFTQTNEYMARRLLEYVANEVTGEVLIDAYCGSGFFAHGLAGRLQKVIGVDWNAAAIKSARESAECNEEYVAADVADVIESLLFQYRPETIILDPSSDGLDDRVSCALLAAPPDSIIYVSCNPATLARDMARLRDGFEINVVQPFDMFPQTAEIETVTVLARMNSASKVA